MNYFCLNNIFRYHFHTWLFLCVIASSSGNICFAVGEESANSVITIKLLDSLKSAINEGKTSELSKDSIRLLGQIYDNPQSADDQQVLDTFALVTEAAKICDENERRCDAAEISTLAMRLRLSQLQRSAGQQDAAWGLRYFELRRNDQIIKQLRLLDSRIYSPSKSPAANSFTSMHPRKPVGQPAIFRYTLECRVTGSSNAPRQARGSTNQPKMAFAINCPDQTIVFNPLLVSDEMVDISLGIRTEVIVKGKVVRKLISTGPIAVRFYEIKPQAVEAKGLFSDQVLTEEYKLETMNCVDAGTRSGPIIWLH